MTTAVLPIKHAWKNRQNRRMALVPYYEYQRVMEAQIFMMKDQKPVIKMVTSVAQAIEMAMSEIKRQRDALKPKKKTTALERSVMNHWGGGGGLKLVLRRQPHPQFLKWQKNTQLAVRLARQPPNPPTNHHGNHINHVEAKTRTQQIQRVT